MMTPKPLFVPLATGPFEQFKNRTKTVEVRPATPRWSEKHVRLGRRVRLRRGYSTTDELHGFITKVYRGLWREAPSWMAVAARVGDTSEYVDLTRPVVAFEVNLDA